jgi:metallo-beta-lactamase family protein
MLSLLGRENGHTGHLTLAQTAVPHPRSRHRLVTAVPSGGSTFVPTADIDHDLDLAARINHHGAVGRHRLPPPAQPDGQSVLVDCDHQGAEPRAKRRGQTPGQLPHRSGARWSSPRAIDHVRRIPGCWRPVIAGPIVCSQALRRCCRWSSNALKVGSRDQALISAFSNLRQQTIAVPYKQWRTIISGEVALRVRLSPAGHILGSAYVEFDLKRGQETQRVVFSGDLGAPYTPLLPAPRSPYGADVVVLESTYGDRTHESRKDRRQRLQALCERCFGNKGSLLIPAFSIGRTQELLYELEDHPPQPPASRRSGRHLGRPRHHRRLAAGGRFHHRLWPAARALGQRSPAKVAAGAPLAFEQLTIDDHATHLGAVSTGVPRPAIIAASGMAVAAIVETQGDARRPAPRCPAHRPRRPARGQANQQWRRAAISTRRSALPHPAGIHTLGGYSHADQKDLLNFIGRMRQKPRQVRLVHGDAGAKQSLAAAIRQRHPNTEVIIP